MTINQVPSFFNRRTRQEQKLSEISICINSTPVDLSVVVKVFETFQHLSQNCCYCNFIKNTTGTICCSHTMLDNVQQRTCNSSVNSKLTSQTRQHIQLHVHHIWYPHVLSDFPSFQFYPISLHFNCYARLRVMHTESNWSCQSTATAASTTMMLHCSSTVNHYGLT